MSPDSCDFSIRAKCVEDLTAVMEEHLQEHVRALEEVAASRYEEKTDSYNVLADDPREVYLEFGRACDVDEECGSSDQNRQNDRRSSESLVVIDESSEVSDVPKSDLPACDDRTPVVDVLPQDHTEHVGSELKSEERKQALSMLSYLNKVATGRAKSLTELKCAICDPPKFFTAQTSLVCHYRSHAGIKPFICSTCGSSFTRQHSLNYHTMLHTNAVKFRCDFCGHVCRHRAHFKEHLRKHTGETPFVCPDCGLGFKTRNTFKRHLCHRHGKILTAEGGVVAMTEEEFRKVRTKPRRLKQEVKPEKKSKECSKDFAEAEFRSSDSDP